MFRIKKSVAVSPNRQGYIYFKSLLYPELPRHQQQTIIDLCRECGGEYYVALFQFVTTDEGAMAICIRHHLSQSTLERVVKKYYEQFPANF